MTLVVVLVKRNRLQPESQLNFHSFKYFGGVIDTEAYHNRGYYIRRAMGQDVGAVTSLLQSVARKEPLHV